MKFDFDVDNKISIIEQSLHNGSYDIVVKESVVIFEYLLRKMFKNRVIEATTFSERSELQELEQKIGKGKKGFEDFGFGELIGLERQTNMLEKWAESAGVTLDFLNSNDLNKINSLRKKCVHIKDGVSDEIGKYEADMVFNYLIYILTKLGITEVKKLEPQIISETVRIPSGDESESNIQKLLLSVNDLYPYIESKVEKELGKGNRVEIINFGLDLETVWPNLLVKIITQSLNWKNVDFKALIIDPESEKIKEYCDNFISPSIAKETIKKAKIFLKKFETNLTNNNVDITIKKYQDLPIIHGFCINREYLFFSLTTFEHDELNGGYGTYIHVGENNEDQLRNYYLESFNSWFDHYFKTSEHI